MSKKLSSSLLAEKEFDVFLSFFSETSLGDELDNSLLQMGIRTFKSNSWKEITVGPIDQQTLQALEKSKVAVVMASEKPYSPGFLEELVRILKFHERQSLTVIPVFHSVYLRHTEDISKHYLGSHAEKYQERVAVWRDALSKFDKMATQYPFSQYISGLEQSDRMKKIADDIWLMLLSSASSGDFRGLSGMDRHLEAFYKLLALESVEGVRTIGIWGKSGVGKTTIARLTFEKISVNFQTNVFLESIENMEDKLLSEKFEREKDVTRNFVHERHEITEARFKHRKVLLIADGVTNVEQGKWIAEYANWFAPGSRVILITQEERLLLDSGVNHVYEVGSLRYDEALRFFSVFAFKQLYPPPAFERLSVRAIQLAGFLPLTLKVFGLFLTGRGQSEWEDVLLQLNAKQGNKIMEVWKLMEKPAVKNIAETSKK